MNKPNLATCILRAFGLITLRNHETKCTRLARFIRDRDAMIRWANAERAAIAESLREVAQQRDDAYAVAYKAEKLCVLVRTLRNQVDTQVDTIKYLKRELDNAERELFGMALRSPSNGGIQ
jgi:diphthamide synthase subunit DPH2